MELEFLRSSGEGSGALKADAGAYSRVMHVSQFIAMQYMDVYMYLRVDS
jgi:hypothetical protein